MSQNDLGFAELSTDLVQPADIKLAGTMSLDFDGHISSPILLHEDLAQGCGGQAWPAGMVLANYLIRNQSQAVVHKSIIEIGSGGGLVGLAIARGCPGFRIPLHITDQENMVPLMKKNMELNGMQASVQASVYNWGQDVPKFIPQYPDIVLAADCVYFEPAFPLLLKTLVDLVGPQTVCYFCFKKRRRADLHFLKSLKKSFNVLSVEDDPDKSHYNRESIFLLEIRQKKKDLGMVKLRKGIAIPRID